MLSREKLADIVRDEVENEIRNGKYPVRLRKGEYGNISYYILLDGSMYQAGNYIREVEEGKRSPNDIYAYVSEWSPPSKNFGAFLFHTNYLDVPSVRDVIYFYLRKAGFTIVNGHEEPPIPNLKYFIRAMVEYSDTPEYLVVNIYGVDSLAESFRIPQIVKQRLGNKPGKITYDDVLKIYNIVTKNQPLLAGHIYYDAWNILLNYLVLHEEAFKDEAYKVASAYLQLFPESYKACYEWRDGRFLKTDCLKLLLRSFSS